MSNWRNQKCDTCGKTRNRQCYLGPPPHPTVIHGDGRVEDACSQWVLREAPIKGDLSYDPLEGYA